MKVFIEEQNIPIDLEWDTYDITAIHFAVFKNGQPIAYARVVQKEGALWIGRMAVDKSQRSKGIGSFLIQQAIKAMRSLNPNQAIYVSAQLAAIDFYKKIIGSKNVAFVDNKTYDLLSVSYAALVTSGTATLETALFKVPQVVCYKGSIISYQIAKRIITLRFISLVNLIMDKEVVKELIQKDFTKKNLTKELAMILDDNHRSKIFENYYQLEQKLGGKGASKNTATSIMSKLN